MNHISRLLGLALALALAAGLAFSQSAGDFRSHQSGNWGDDSTWEQYNGISWVWPAPSIPSALYETTVRTGDSVVVIDSSKTYVGTSTIETGAVVTVVGFGDTVRSLNVVNGALTVNGTLMQTGLPATGPYAINTMSGGAIVVGNGGVVRQDQNGGQIPLAIWNTGSTLLVTGITSSTSWGGNGIQDFYNVEWNCPNQTTNCNMGWHPPSTTTSFDTTVTIRGNITVRSTGLARAYMCGVRAGTPTVPNNTHITVNGNITVLNGAIFSSNGTSNAYTNIYVTVLGNISVRDSAFLSTSVWQWSQMSISRGSQGGTGTTTWYLKGDSIYYGPKTTNQNSTDAATAITSKGKFIFCKPGTQVVTLDTLVNWTGPCNMQFGDSIAATTVLIGNSPFIGSGTVQRIKRNATVVIGTDGYIGGGNNSTPLPSNFAMDDGATLVLASQNGIKATGTGSSGAVRVTGNRFYGNAASFVYNGTSHQRLGSGFPASLHNLTIDNPAGAYIDSVAGFTVAGTLTVTNGDLDLNGATVTLGAAATLSESPGNTVTGTSGVITTTRTLTAPSSLVDIAGLGVAVGSAADLGSTVLTRGHAPQGGGSISRWFDVAPTTNTALSATLVFKYDASELNGQNAATMSLWKSTDAGATWHTQAAVNNAAGHTLTASGLNDLSRWSASDALHPLGAVQMQMTMQAGWNMVSLPLRVLDGRKSVVFPTAKSSAFAYASTYVVKDTMQFGTGYWLKYDSLRTVAISGTFVTDETLRVNKGWNIIGSLSEKIPLSSLTSIPGGLRSSSLFGYNHNYVIVDTIVPGAAYWLKALDTGRIVFHGPSAGVPKLSAANRLVIVSDGEMPPPPPPGSEEVNAAPAPGFPTTFALSQNYPNPFNPVTSFAISVPVTAQVDVAIYNLLGQRIRSIFSGEADAGYHTLAWDGMTDGSILAGNGVYFLRMASGSFVAVNKLLFMK